MIAVKIECECGQHYAFDVEPVSGRMPTPVACPTCGADGTPAANEIIALRSPPSEPVYVVPPPPPPVPQSSVRVKVSAADHAPAKISGADARKMGIVDREQAEIEARAKMSWGDSPDAVTKYLMLQGFSVPEAREVVAGLYKERLAAVRTNGIKKIVSGIALMLVPVVTFLFFLYMRMMFVRLMAIAVAIGLWGVWRVVNGLIALLMPKMESGDVAEQ
jgi:hypothetical protein